jgi:WD40 repeat protein
VPVAGHGARVFGLAFTPDGKQAITATHERDFRSWDCRSGKPCAAGKEDGERLQGDALASLGRAMLSLCDNGFDDGAGLLPMPRLSRLRQPPVVFSTSADGRRVLALKKEPRGKPSLVVSDARTDKVVRTFIWTEGDKVSASLSPDGRTVAAAVGDTVRFLDVGTGKQRRFVLSKRGEDFRPIFVKFAPDGSRVVVIGDPATLRVVSVADGRLLGTIHETVWNFTDRLADLAVSADGRSVAVGKFMGSLMLWEVATGQLVRHHRADGLLFSPDNRRFAILQRGTLSVHDLFSGSSLWQYREPNGFTGNLAFSPDGRFLAAACRDTTVLVWHLASLDRGVKRRPLDDAALERLWNDLRVPAPGGPSVESWRRRPGMYWRDGAKGKSARAFEVMGLLVANPRRSVPFLKKRLHVPPADARLVRRLIADLDSDTFATREAASRALAKLGRSAAVGLRAAAAGKPSPEVRLRVRRLLRPIEREEDKLSLASTRTVQVLEAIGTRDARAFLKSLAEGGGGPHAGREARAALERLQARPAAGDHLRGISAEPWLRQARALAAIGKLGGKVQAEARGRRKVVVGVDLGGTRATDEDLRLLSNLASLRTLNLFNTKITGAGLAHLKGLTALEEIDLSWPLPGYAEAVCDSFRPRPLDEGALEHLKALPALRAVNLEYTALGEVGCGHLGGLTNLRDLDLRCARVTDGMLRRLAGLTRLQRLELTRTAVTDRGMAALARLEMLQDLGLGGTKLSDTGLRVIGRLRRLEDLSLNDTRVTDAGLAHLRGLKKLHTLGLDNTAVKGAGLAHLKGLSNLRHLSVAGAPVANAGLEHLRGLTRLERLDLSGTKVTAAGLGRLQTLTGLRDLVLGGRADDAALQQVARLSGLRGLSLNRSAVTDRGLLHLKRLTRLSWLGLAGTQVTDAGLARLRDLPELTSLALGGDRLTDAGLKHLRALPRLKELWLTSDARFTAGGLVDLQQALPRLKVDRNVSIRAER